MFYTSILYIKIIFPTHENNIFTQNTANIQMHSPVATESNSHRYNHRHNNNHRYNHHHKLQPQSPDPPTNSKSKNLNQKKKKTQNLQQNPNPTDQSMTKLNQPSATRSAERAVEDDEQRTTTVEDDEQRTATVEDDEQRLATVEDDEQRSATSPGWAEVQIGELQSASSASYQNCLLLRDRKRKRERWW